MLHHYAEAVPIQAYYRPIGFQVSGCHISRQLAHEGDKVVSPMYRPPLPHEILQIHISVRGWVDPRAIQQQM
jgi:hypothetical protein